MSVDRRLAAVAARAVESNSGPAGDSDRLARKYQAMASSMVANWDRLGPVEQMSHAERMVLSLITGVNVMAPQSEFDAKVRAEAEHARNCLIDDRRARRWETQVAIEDYRGARAVANLMRHAADLISERSDTIPTPKTS